ncbi:cupin domain-containing protein [Belliella pelovolcani]|uniref:cupin domain-containing protein n=1 Tax=Belliella pelovolcani TaxID=529505 RepID=UPI003918B81E
MKKTIINPLFKDQVTFTNTSEETNGELTELDLVLSPKGGNPMHHHTSFEEKFTAVAGELGLKLKGKTLLLKPGESYTVKPLEAHGFFNPSEENEIKFNIKITPGHTGFENSLRIMYGLAQDGLTDKNGIPKNLGVAFWLGELNDSKVHGIAFKILQPLGNILAKKVKNKGIDKELIHKYCR